MTEDILNDELIKKIPLGRAGNVEDIVPLVNFLSSEHSNYITGLVNSIMGELIYTKTQYMATSYRQYPFKFTT